MICLELNGISLRDYQQQVVEFVTKTLSTERHAAVEAPTGSGKTLMALISALSSRRDGEKILYLTRTNTQQEQVMSDLSRLSGSMRIKAVAMQGRGNLCLLYREIEGQKEFSSQSLSRFCSSRKRKVSMGFPDACRFFNPGIRTGEARSFFFDSYPTAEQTLKYGIEKQICPYEAIKFHMKEADLVVAPYAYYINRSVGDRLLYSMGVSRDKLIVVLDECHNLPDLARNTAGFDISVEAINRAEREVIAFGDRELEPRVRASDLLEMVRSAIIRMVSTLESDDRRIAFHDLLEEIMIGNRMNSNRVSSLFMYLNLLGEEIEEKMEADGKVPRSRTLSLASRLTAWENSDENQFAAILSREDEGTLQAVCMDPSETLSVLRESRTIHFSGTLEPFSAYARITGFEGIKKLRITGVFPENRKLSVYDKKLSSRYDDLDDDLLERMRTVISDLVIKTGRKTMIFFPSYSLMEQVLSLGFEFTMLAEERGLTQEEITELISDFRKNDFPLFAVAGGRLSEGMNFPGSQLEMVILAGIPYPKPDARNKAIQDYYDRVYGRGWEYSVTFPTSIKVRQILGRLIRSETDFGAGVILDHRASNFRQYIDGLYPAEDVVGECLKFFERFDGN